MIKAILMDFNGVIIDDEAIQFEAYRDILSSDGVDLTDENYYSSLGMDDRTFVAAQYERAGKTVDNKRIAEIIEGKSAKWQNTISQDLPLFDGIENFIVKMSQDLILGIVSMSSRSDIDHVLDLSGLRKYFETIVSADDVTNCKPDPECFRIGFQQLDALRMSRGHSPMVHADCLVIEDSPAGIKGALEAGLMAFGVSNSVSPPALRQAGAAAVTGDLRDWVPDTIRLVFV